MIFSWFGKRCYSNLFLRPWIVSLNISGLARIFHELLSRDHETGNPLAGLSGAQRARRGWTCHRATAGCWFRGVPERYVAGRACPEPVEGTPEDARKGDHIRGRSK
ncbi:MAG: hypothetical protein OEV09_14725 [Deltaproteobacteria bacterium]|nr:hypothetical protein [Deltaproteobacteria bacterium]